MASSICCLIFKYALKESLLQSPGSDFSTLNALSQLIARSLSIIALDDYDVAESSHDLNDIPQPCWDQETETRAFLRQSGYVTLNFQMKVLESCWHCNWLLDRLN